jgi:Ca2+-binding EF-hand superfamily protein
LFRCQRKGTSLEEVEVKMQSLRSGKAPVTLMAITAALVLGTSLAVAQGTGPGMGPGMGPGGGGAMMMQRFDADNNGTITEDEFAAGHDDWFKTLDANNDGAISREEFTGTVPAGKRAAQMFTRHDANGNGSIDAAEFRQTHSARFQRMDANKDGALTGDEMAFRRGGGRGPGSGPGGGPGAGMKGGPGGGMGPGAGAGPGPRGPQ